MGIFDRVKRIIKANLNASDRSFEDILNDSDEELKRLIDELSSKKNGEDKAGAKQANNSTPPRRDAGSRSGSSGQQSRNSASDSSQGSSRQDPAMRAQVQAVYRAYKVLGLDADANVDQIKKAYRSRMREVHPDRVANASAAEQDKAKRQAQELNAAYDVLAKVRGIN